MDDPVEKTATRAHLAAAREALASPYTRHVPTNSSATCAARRAQAVWARSEAEAERASQAPLLEPSCKNPLTGDPRLAITAIARDGRAGVPPGSLALPAPPAGSHGSLAALLGAHRATLRTVLGGAEHQPEGRGGSSSLRWRSDGFTEETKKA
jgi:hypothetical protein